MNRHQLHLNGVRTPCLDSGGESREAVLFMHGNPGSGADWEDLASRVAPHCRTLAPDMPGFGRAEKPDDFNYTVDGYADHIEALLAERGIDRVHLVLHDFGGGWGLAWATRHPERVASMTLLNIGVLRGYRWHFMARLWRAPIVGELVMATTTRFGFRQLLKIGNPRGLPREYVDQMFDNFDAGTRRAVLRLYRATDDLSGAADAAVAALKPHDIDCLVIWGKADIYLPWRYAEAQREAFPRAEVIYLDDSGHWPFIDNPEAVAAAVVPFMQRVCGGREAKTRG
ncbi:MAG: alpha/beta fold hydrolase [Gammaproteobacteria bacterium]